MGVCVCVGAGWGCKQSVLCCGVGETVTVSSSIGKCYVDELKYGTCVSFVVDLTKVIRLMDVVAVVVMVEAREEES